MAFSRHLLTPRGHEHRASVSRGMAYGNHLPDWQIVWPTIEQHGRCWVEQCDAVLTQSFAASIRWPTTIVRSRLVLRPTLLSWYIEHSDTYTDRWCTPKHSLILESSFVLGSRYVSILLSCGLAAWVLVRVRGGHLRESGAVAPGIGGTWDKHKAWH